MVSYVCAEVSNSSTLTYLYKQYCTLNDHTGEMKTCMFGGFGECGFSKKISKPHVPVGLLVHAHAYRYLQYTVYELTMKM